MGNLFKAVLPVVAVILIALILLHPVAHAILPLLIGLVFVITFAAAYGYFYGLSQGYAKGVYEKYRNDTDLYTKNLMTVYEDAWRNILIQLDDSHNLFFNNTYSYYARWAESIASTLCNENKTAITDEDLDPIVNDLTTILENYVSRYIDSLVDLYKKAYSLALQRKNAGLQDTNIGFVGGGGIFNNYVTGYAAGYVNDLGQVCGFGGCMTPVQLQVKINNQIIGVYYFSNNIKIVNKTEIKQILLSGTTFDVSIVITSTGTDSAVVQYFVRYNETSQAWEVVTSFNLEKNLEKYFNDVKTLYTSVKNDADSYCYMISTTGGQQIPPPSVALPYDLETLNKMDPLSRMQLYQTYLYYLSQTDWSKVQKLTSDQIYGLPDKTVKIYGTVTLPDNTTYTGYFIPMNIPKQFVFNVNKTGEIAGVWYWYDPNTNTMRIVRIPENSTITPEIIYDVKYDPETGEYKQYNVDSIEVGPKNAKEWATMRLIDVGALSPIDTLKLGFINWIKLAIVAGAGILLFLIIRSFAGGTRVTVVNTRR